MFNYTTAKVSWKISSNPDFQDYQLILRLEQRNDGFLNYETQSGVGTVIIVNKTNFSNSAFYVLNDLGKSYNAHQIIHTLAC